MMRRTVILTAALAAAAFGACGGSDEPGRERADTSSQSAGELGPSERGGIAFVRSGGSPDDGFNRPDIYVMDADGSQQRNLTGTPKLVEGGPAWSPAGRRIVFAREEGKKRRDIYVMNADGSDQTNLTNSPHTDEGDPAWSPDGRRIAFARLENNQSDIHVMNADGDGQRNLTESPQVHELAPAWSPDGQRIVFTHVPRLKTDPAAARGDIFVMNADGSAQRNVTGGPDMDDVIPNGPTFSPDGERIAFVGLREGERAHMVWVMNADGSEATPLAPGAPFSPSFSPDGRRIAFTGRRPGIYVMNADGSDQTPLTNIPNDQSPDWSPASERSP